jgi:DNA processing protein
VSESSELAHWVALHAVPGMGPVTFRRLLDRFGAPLEALAADADALRGVKGMTAEVAEGMKAARRRLNWAGRMAESLAKKGVQIVRVGDAAYPASLLDLPNPPPLLYVFGEITEADRRSVSIVGTTKPSPKGRPITEEFASRFAAAGVTVVSGFAHGIDAAAHRGAFKGGGRSILCIPYGIRRFKPRADFPPLPELKNRGAIVTECPPEREWSASAAVARDRIIAALGRATFVIETRPKGGTLHTVKSAQLLRRPLFALKYSRAPESARGNSILIARGATEIRMFGDIGVIIEAMGS